MALGLLLVGCGDQSRETSSAPTGSSSGNYALSVQVGGDGSVTSTPSGINCAPLGGICRAVYARDTSVTLVAAPGTDFDFDGWTGDTSCGSDTTCTVSMTSTRQLSANFGRKRQRLTVTVNGSGTVTSTPGGINCGTSCSANFPTGSSVTLSATPASGYAFAGWSGAGVNCPGTGNCTVSMTAA
ncbi:MAG: InlB B-repeat-containing protein, partial [Sulfurifustaceae bacterium]